MSLYYSVAVEERINSGMERIAKGIFVVFAVICVLLPSGKIGPINIKFMLLVVELFVLMLTNIKFSKSELLLYGSSLLWIFIWLVIGAFSLGGLAMSIAQAKAIGATLVVVFLTELLLRREVISSKDVFYLVIWSAVGLAIFKMLLVGYSMITDNNFYNVVSTISKYFDTQIMTMKITGPFYRYQVPSDLITPIALYIMLRSRRVTSLIKSRALILFIIILLVFSAFLSYSRYIWAFCFLSVLLASFTNKKIIMYLVGLSLLMMAIILAQNGLSKVLDYRFFSSAVVISDNTRMIELQALLSYMNNWHILFGHGLGAYVPWYLRDHKDKFSYELQWLALLMQVGIIGVSYILLLLFLLIKPFITQALSMRKVQVLCLLFIWLSASLFNPYLLSSVSGVIFSYFVAERYLVVRFGSGGEIYCN
jgi:hypothetical protein